MSDPIPTGISEPVDAEDRVLNRVIEVLFSGTNLDLVLQATADLIVQATGADACFVHLVDPVRGSLVLRAATGVHAPAVGRAGPALGAGITGWVAEHASPVVVEDDARRHARYVHEPETERYRSLVSVPLASASGNVTGAVSIHNEASTTFARGTVAFLEHVASLLAAAVEHAALFLELERKERALEGIIERTVQAQEEERRRVATDIHDGVMQQLISVWYRVNACERSLESDPLQARSELEAAKSLIDEALAEARSAIYDLRPTTLDDLGIAPALEALARRTLGDEFDVSIATDLDRALPGHLETTLYRIAQETLNNIRKHAGPCRVEIGLETSSDGREVAMRVVDTGRGFDLVGYQRGRPETSYGLLGMKERIALIRGRLTIRSAAAKGTAVEVRVPLEVGRLGGSRLD
ncbi:MAG: GAF domain-containing protein [Actinomycetota bacterium]